MFFRHLNWLIAAGLLSAGIAVIWWPSLTLDTTASAPTTAATLAGALFGAAALFAGAQINEISRRRDAEVELQNERGRVRAMLDNEFIRVCVNLMQYAHELSKSLNYEGQIAGFGEPLPNPIFESVRSELLCLPEAEIDVLCTFYSGLDATRREIRDESRAFNVYRILGHVHHDLKTAEEAARKIWPTRKIQSAGGQLCVLADKLKEQADVVAKVLEPGPPEPTGRAGSKW
jgi:hypothetical protein